MNGLRATAWGRVWSCFAVLCGCGNEGGDGPADPGITGPQAIELRQDACREYSTVICNYMFRCFSEEDWDNVAYSISDEASCPEQVQAVTCADPKVVDPIADGRQIFYRDRVDSCVSIIEDASCMTPADFFWHPERVRACELTEGTVPPGGDCVNWEDCEGPYSVCNPSGVCEAGSETDYQLECELPIEDGECPGETCVSYFDNVQGITGTCTRFCFKDDDCGLNGVCVPFNGDGLCLHACLDDGDCSGGFVCVRDEDELVGLCSIEVL